MKKLLTIAAFVVLQACAFTDSKLNVAHSPDAPFQGPLSDIDSMTFSIDSLSDSRDDTVRVGWKKNGYGAKTADILSVTPVPEVVANGIAAGFEANNHKQLENGRVKVNGEVTKFWFDFKPNMFTVEFFGYANATLEFVDTESGEVFYKSDYTGSYTEKKAGGMEKTWAGILQKALDKLIEDVVFDEDLAEALEEL